MNSIQKLFTSRANGADSATYVGELDRIWWDPVTNSFYYSDGKTPGGFPIAGGGGGGGGCFTGGVGGFGGKGGDGLVIATAW